MRGIPILARSIHVSLCTYEQFVSNTQNNLSIRKRFPGIIEYNGTVVQMTQ